MRGMTETLIHTACAGVLTLTLNRPEQRNALTHDLIDQLLAALNTAAEDKRTRVLVLTGRETAFSAGLDLAEMRADADRLVCRFGELLTALEQFPKGLLVAVNGDAVAGGFAMVACSDVAVANERARFGLPGVRRGVFPGVIVKTLARQLAPRVLRHLMVDGHLINADRALALGLVDELVEPDQLLSVAEERAHRLLDNPVEVVTQTKRWLMRLDEDIPPLFVARAGANFDKMPEGT